MKPNVLPNFLERDDRPGEGVGYSLIGIVG